VLEHWFTDSDQRFALSLARRRGSDPGELGEVAA
jgi:hypothetical protein